MMRTLAKYCDIRQLTGLHYSSTNITTSTRSHWEGENFTNNISHQIPNNTEFRFHCMRYSEIFRGWLFGKTSRIWAILLHTNYLFLWRGPWCFATFLHKVCCWQIPDWRGAFDSHQGVGRCSYLLDMVLDDFFLCLDGGRHVEDWK